MKLLFTILITILLFTCTTDDNKKQVVPRYCYEIYQYGHRIDRVCGERYFLIKYYKTTIIKVFSYNRLISTIRIVGEFTLIVVR